MDEECSESRMMKNILVDHKPFLLSPLIRARLIGSWEHSAIVTLCPDPRGLSRKICGGNEMEMMGDRDADRDGDGRQSFLMLLLSWLMSLLAHNYTFQPGFQHRFCSLSASKNLPGKCCANTFTRAVLGTWREKGGMHRHRNPEVTAPMRSTEQALCRSALPAPFILDLKHLLIIHSLTSPTQDAVSLYGSHMEQRDRSQYTLSIRNKVYNGTVTKAAGSAPCQSALVLAAGSSCAWYDKAWRISLS